MAHLWSLAVEEQFYLLWPAIVLVASRPALIRICIGCAALALAVRIGLRFSALPWYSCLLLSPARLDDLSLGALVAVLLRVPGAKPVIARWCSRVAVAAGAVCGGIFLSRRFTDGQDPIIGTVGVTSFGLFAA